MPMTDRSAQDVIDEFYQSVANKDNRWQDLWAEDVVFGDASGALHAEGRAAVNQSFVPFLKGVVMLEVRQKILQGAQACYVVSYTYVNSKGENLHQDDAEVWEVRDGKLAKLTIYFDVTEFRSFMRR
jgi:ketosteroid isomerase-like protein